MKEGRERIPMRFSARLLRQLRDLADEHGRTFTDEVAMEHFD